MKTKNEVTDEILECENDRTVWEGKEVVMNKKLTNEVDHHVDEAMKENLTGETGRTVMMTNEGDHHVDESMKENLTGETGRTLTSGNDCTVVEGKFSMMTNEDDKWD